MAHWGLPWVLALWVVTGSATGKTKYTLDDLSALAEQQAWRELVEHLTDVPPAQRKEAWQSLAERAALGLMETEPPTESLVGPLLRNLPSLKKSPAVLEKRAQVGLTAFEQCYVTLGREDDCTQRLVRFCQEDPTNVPLSLGAARLIARHQNPAVGLEAFAVALSPKTAPALCGDETLHRGVLTALGHPNGRLLELAVKIADRYCWTQVKGPAMKEFDREMKGYVVTNLCPLLKKKKETLSGLRAVKCKPKA